MDPVYGARLRSVRVERGLRQVDVAVSLEMSSGGYSSIERGKARIFLADLPRYAQALNVPQDYLVRRLGICDVANDDDDDLTARLTRTMGPVLGPLLARVDRAAAAWQEEQRTTLKVVMESLLSSGPKA